MHTPSIPLFKKIMGAFTLEGILNKNVVIESFMFYNRSVHATKDKQHCFVTFNRSSLIKSHKLHCLKGRVGATFKTKDFIKEA